MLFYPKMYQRTIHDIHYQKLKAFGIKCLIFDLDNTIALIDQSFISEETKKLVKGLKQDFQIIIISNNTQSRVKPYADSIDCEYICNASKPFSKGFYKIRKKYHFEKKEMCIIGDQMVTDILGGNCYHIFTVLVDPLGKKDLKVTIFNRFIEKKVWSQYAKKGIMKKGEYYE